MKFIKKVLVVLFSVVAIILVVSLFLPKQFRVERTVRIDKPKEEVFEYIRYLRNQEEYSAWSQLDPDMEKDYEGIDGEIGFVSSWKSKHDKVGIGQQEITNIDEGNRIEYIIHIDEPRESVATAYMLTESINNDTEITWGLTGDVSWPFNFFLLIDNIDDKLGSQLELGLQNLKKEID